MTWSVNIEKAPIKEALSQIRQQEKLPEDVRRYLIQGLLGMELYYENLTDFDVKIHGHGHLGNEGYPITTAMLSIERVV